TPDRLPSPAQGSVAPSGPPVLGADWRRAASLDRPENFMESVPPDYISNHPILRVAGQAIMTDVASGEHGDLVAVGYAPPDWLPIAWTSANGNSGTIHAMGTATETFPMGVTVGPEDLRVAVGRSGKLPVVWTSADGATWSEHPVPVLGPSGIAERLTSIVATDNGYVAGGSIGPELAE